LGPALVVGGTALSQVWLFIVAPLVGAIVAAIIHLILSDMSKEEVVEVVEVTA
jgi:aquaporin Z